MEIFPIIISFFFVLLAVVSAQKKATQKKDAQAQAIDRQKQLERQQPRPVLPDVPAPATVTQVSGQTYIPTLPDRKPPQPKVQVSVKPNVVVAEGAGSHEGVEFHAAGFHGDAPARAASQREKPAQQPGEAEDRPMFTAQDLRNAFVMQEILDEPVSRRRRGGYGR